MLRKRKPCSSNPTQIPADCAQAAQESAAELAQANASIRRREDLLTASARASRLLLEEVDAMGAMPQVLRLIGEAASVDRIDLMLAQTGPGGEPLLVVTAEWVAEGVTPHLGDPVLGSCDLRNYPEHCSELQAGRSVCINKDHGDTGEFCKFEGAGTKSKAIVPIFIDSEFVGIVGFDNTRQRRPVDSAELAALETAAGVIGAALHRERLHEAVRRERELAAEQRVAELVKANAALRLNLQRLASQPDIGNFLSHMLLETAKEVGAASASAVVQFPSRNEWHVVAHVCGGRIEEPPFASKVPDSQAGLPRLMSLSHEPLRLETIGEVEISWPGVLEFHQAQGHQSEYIVPLIFGDRIVGFIALAFRHVEPLDSERSELLVELAQQATLAIGLKRLAYSAKDAAVLAERNRIGQEIHDGLAQAFTGILMQLGAAEELETTARNPTLSVVLARIRDIAKEGLAEARRSVLTMRPELARRGGLVLALRQLAERSTVANRVTCSFEGIEVVSGLPPEHEHELLRIAQEAVSNALRHAHPSQVRISMSEESAHWELAVTDDGCGMDPRTDHYVQQGFGLTNMRERAGAIGGEWQISTRRAEGTRVSVRLPKRVLQ
jgi:signal transduction histidine kinase